MTIFALSSGAPPAGIAVIRISGAEAFSAVTRLAGSLPAAREARVRALRDDDGNLLDRALVVCFPGPQSATGEDLAELHCHGSRAVVAALLTALGRIDGLRPAEAGEFTRRALSNGRIDLAEARGLADLLSADTERQRIVALRAAEGIVSQLVNGWLDRLAMLAAMVEAQLDFADEGDVAVEGDPLIRVRDGMAALAQELAAVLSEPPVERLRDGIHVVLAGPPNSGKSTLINLLSQREVAIVSPIAGTTRDRIEVQVVRAGLAFVLTDTAGLTATDDPIETIGVGLAGSAIDGADILVWLGDDVPPRTDAIWLHSRADERGREAFPEHRLLAVSRDDRASIVALWDLIAGRAERLVPRSDMAALRADERHAVSVAMAAIAEPSFDALLIAEDLRVASRALGTILGIDATEAMLDSLFGRFCIGK